MLNIPTYQGSMLNMPTDQGSTFNADHCPDVLRDGTHDVYNVKSIITPPSRPALP